MKPNKSMQPSTDQRIQMGYDWIFRILFLSFALPANVQTLILLVTTLVSVFHGILITTSNHKSALYQPLLLTLPFLFFPIYFLVAPSTDYSALWMYTERSVSLFILPFVSYSIMQQHPFGLRKNLSWFVLPIVLQACYTCLLTLWHAPPNAVAFRILFETISGKHPTYMGLHVVFALFILVIEKRQACFQQKSLVYISSVILTLTLILLLPKISVLALVLGLVFYGIFYYRTQPRRLLLLFGLGALLLFLLVQLPFIHTRLSELFILFGNPSATAGLNTVALRKVLLQLDFNLLKQHWLFGLGPVQLQAELNKQLWFYSSSIGIPVGSYNTHNEYLNQWLCFGLAGISIFLFTLYRYITKAVKQRNSLFLLTLLLVMLTMFTENILTRQHGVVFYALWLSLFYFETSKQNA